MPTEPPDEPVVQVESTDMGGPLPPPAVPVRLIQHLESLKGQRTLVGGSHLHGASFARWTEMRSFIAHFIHRSGTLLDIGCANGLLLACLISWTRHEVVPYGVDVDDAALRSARRLLPEWSGNFAQASLGNLKRLPAMGFPSTFDFVYWNVWDDLDFPERWHLAYARDALDRVGPGGRLCLGFYDGDAVVIGRKIARLTDLVGPTAARAASPDGSQVAVWWELRDDPSSSPFAMS